MIAMSSFGGVAPQLALEWLAKIKGNQYNCVIVAIYGNRAYKNTLCTDGRLCCYSKFSSDCDYIGSCGNGKKKAYSVRKECELFI